MAVGRLSREREVRSQRLLDGLPRPRGPRGGEGVRNVPAPEGVVRGGPQSHYELAAPSGDGNVPPTPPGGIPPGGQGGGGGEPPMTRREAEERISRRDRDWRGRNLAGTDLRELSLTRINFAGAHMHRTRLDRAGLIVVVEEGTRWQEKAGWHDLRGLDLREVDMRNLGLISRLDEDEVSMGVPNLEGLQFILNPNGPSPETRNLDLSRANIENALIGGAHFDDGQLFNVIRGGSRWNETHHDLREISLPHEHVVAATLSDVDLSGSNLTGTQVNGISMQGSRLTGALMIGTHLGRDQLIQVIEGGSRWDRAKGRHDLRYVNLTGASLHYLDLHDVDLDQAVLDYTHYGETQISRRPLVYNVMRVVNAHVGKDALGPSEVLLPAMRILVQNFAGGLELREGVQLYRTVPDTNSQTVHQWRMLARQVKGVRGRFRRIIHERPSHTNVDLVHAELARAQSGENLQAAHDLPLLQEMARLGEEIFNARLNLDQARNYVGPSVGRRIFWPESGDHIPLEDLGHLAVSVRETFDSLGGALSERDRWGLMRLGISVDQLAFGLCAFEKGEAYTPVQAEKMATLFRVLYGTGYGDQALLNIADRLDHLAIHWEETSEEQRRSDLYRYGVHGLHMMDEVSHTHHELFDEVVLEHGESWKMDETERQSFTSLRYRSSGVFQMGVHLESLGVRPGRRETVEQVQSLLAQDQPREPVFEPHFIHETSEQNPLVLGGKGLGLVEMATEGYPVPPGFVLPPVHLGARGLSASRRQIIEDGVERLGAAKVSVRSGGAVSMPGMMASVMDRGTVEEIVAAGEDVYRSANNPHAQNFRRVNGIPDDWGTSVTVQQMVDGTRDRRSGSGVAVRMSTDGETIGMRYSYGRQRPGVDLVGDHPGRDRLRNAQVERRLNQIVTELEDRHGYPIEVEFTIESGRLHVLQRRRAHLNYEDNVRWASARVAEGKMTQEEAVRFLGGQRRLQGARETAVLQLEGNEEAITTTGMGNGQPFVGEIALTAERIVDIQAQGGSAIFVTPFSDVEAGATLAIEAGATVFGGGNPLSHMAGVANTMELSYVGALPVQTDEYAGTVTIEGQLLREGDRISLDPRSGTIYRGGVPLIRQVSPVNSLINRLL